MGLTERSFLERMELMGLTESRAVTNADRIRSMSDEELANQLAAEQYGGIRSFLLGFDKELVEDLDKETVKTWSEVVQEKLMWLRQKAEEGK